MWHPCLEGRGFQWIVQGVCPWYSPFGKSNLSEIHNTEGHSFKTRRFFQVIRLCSHRFTFMLMTWKFSSIFSTVIARIPHVGYVKRFNSCRATQFKYEWTMKIYTIHEIHMADRFTPWQSFLCKKCFLFYLQLLSRVDPRGIRYDPPVRYVHPGPSLAQPTTVWGFRTPIYVTVNFQNYVVIL